METEKGNKRFAMLECGERKIQNYTDKPLLMDNCRMLGR